jgi:hypothetical protein
MPHFDGFPWGTDALASFASVLLGLDWTIFDKASAVPIADLIPRYVAIDLLPGGYGFIRFLGVSGSTGRLEKG